MSFKGIQNHLTYISVPEIHKMEKGIYCEDWYDF